MGTIQYRTFDVQVPSSFQAALPPPLPSRNHLYHSLPSLAASQIDLQTDSLHIRQHNHTSTPNQNALPRQSTDARRRTTPLHNTPLPNTSEITAIQL